MGESEGTESRLNLCLKTNNVGFGSQENRRRTESKMGEVEEAAEGGLMSLLSPIPTTHTTPKVSLTGLPASWERDQV